uniref:Agenet domain-containing protein n=1 Tax=Setaria digitata TaxID=48799 RepID=A0A915Q843_9BILA
MYGKYYLGIVLEATNSRIKILRKTKIYQFKCEIAANITAGSWINFSFSRDSATPIIEHFSPVLPTKIVKLTGIDGSTSNRISIQTVAAIPCRPDLNGTCEPFEQYVWSPHFEWVLDKDGIFNNEHVLPNVIYVTWIELLHEPCILNSNVLMKVTEIVRPAHDQLPIYDAPWIGSEMSADAELLSVHCLQNRPKDKINPATVYSGLVLWRDVESRLKQIALWSTATGIVYFRHQRCKNIAVGAWFDFVVRSGKGGVLEAHKLKYSKNQTIPTKVVRGKAQVCEKMKMPEDLPNKDWIWVSDVVGKVWVDYEQFKKSVADRWAELADSTTHVWLSCSQINSTVFWKFESVVEPNECAKTEKDDENIECFADLVIL